MSAEPKLREAYTLVRDVARISRLFQQENVHCAGLTFLQFTILDYVQEGGDGLELSALHDLLAVERSTTTRLLDPLVEKELLVKVPSARDGRALRLGLTPAGRRAHREYWECLAGSLRNAVAPIPPKQYEELKRSLRLFASVVGKACQGDHCR